MNRTHTRIYIYAHTCRLETFSVVPLTLALRICLRDQKLQAACVISDNFTITESV